MPGVFSPEAGLIYVQGGLLVLRTLLSDYVSKLEGRAARWAIQSNGPLLSRTLGQFVAVGASPRSACSACGLSCCCWARCRGWAGLCNDRCQTEASAPRLDEALPLARLSSTSPALPQGCTCTMRGLDVPRHGERARLCHICAVCWPAPPLQVSIPASIVNSGLKYMQRRIKASCQAPAVLFVARELAWAWAGVNEAVAACSRDLC